jgi:glycogen debranching enzyme
MQMSDKGFNIDIRVDWNSGLILGGNEANCGTWMDKMGESVKAGTKGKPGTPRDGAPIEITGLLMSTLRWVEGLSHDGKFPFEGVQADSEANPMHHWGMENSCFTSQLMARADSSRIKNGRTC